MSFNLEMLSLFSIDKISESNSLNLLLSLASSSSLSTKSPKGIYSSTDLQTATAELFIFIFSNPNLKFSVFDKDLIKSIKGFISCSTY